MTPTQLKYFNDMQPGQTLSTNQVNNPAAFIQAAKEYIDLYGTLELNTDHTIVLKLNPIPEDSSIRVIINF